MDMFFFLLGVGVAQFRLMLGCQIPRYVTDNMALLHNYILAMHIFYEQFTDLEERIYLLQSYLSSHKWGYLEMFMLLSEDVKYFVFHGPLDNDQTSKNRRFPELFVPLLISRCPVSRGVE